MSFYASTPARTGTPHASLATLGVVSAPLPSLARDQLFVARAARPVKGTARPASAQVQPIAVHSSTSVPSGQRT